jgi:hypothetical protein
LEVVEDGNIELLKSPERYLKYLIFLTSEIIKDYAIEYHDIKDERKKYPKFTQRQFTLILGVLKSRVFDSNITMLKDDIYKSRYNISKVELAYKVFDMYCLYYNMTSTVQLFCAFTGIEKKLLIEWLNLGKSNLYLDIRENTRNLDDFLMLNSDNALLRLHYRNNEEIEHIQAQNENILPDLLLSDNAKMSLPERQAELLTDHEQFTKTGKTQKTPKSLEK